MYIKAIVTAGVKKENFTVVLSDYFKISVKEKAEKNMANKKIIELLASYFNVSKSKIRIINGHHHPHKLLVVNNEI